MEQTQERKEEITSLFKMLGRFATRPAPKDAIGYGQGQKKIMLYLLHHQEGVLSGELATACLVGTGRIGNVLKDLEKKGLISRQSADDDKRKTIVKITSSGLKLSEEFQDKFLFLTSKLIDKMGEVRFKEFIDLSNVVIDSLEEIRKEEEDKHAQGL